jgi:hypothetical protein
MNLQHPESNGTPRGGEPRGAFVCVAPPGRCGLEPLQGLTCLLGKGRSRRQGMQRDLPRHRRDACRAGRKSLALRSSESEVGPSHFHPLEFPHFRVNNATRRLINLRSDFFDSLENIGRSQVW